MRGRYSLGVKSSETFMSESEDTKYIQGYIRAWATLVIAAAFVLGATLIIVGFLPRLPSGLEDVFRAVGTSVIASLILYVLVSVTLDPKRQVVQARQAILYGIEEANKQFASRFEAALPTAVFEGSRIPKPSFRNAFTDLLSSSTRYDFKGDSANFTSYRLARCRDHPEIRRLDQIRLCVLDPRSERALQVYAEQYLRQEDQPYDPVKTADKAAEIRNDIYVSLWTLYRIRNQVTTSVFFHSDLPFFRCELFDNGLLLTYYLDHRIYPDYPETLQFSASTRPYKAYNSAMTVARHFAPKVVIFSETGPGSDIINTDERFSTLLHSLGCELERDEFEDRQEQRFRTFDNWLGEAGLSSTALF